LHLYDDPQAIFTYTLWSLHEGVKVKKCRKYSKEQIKCIEAIRNCEKISSDIKDLLILSENLYLKEIGEKRLHSIVYELWSLKL
jgi:hypothetical protein